MDQNLFYIATFAGLGLGLFGLTRRESSLGVILMFVGGLVDLFTMLGANADGNITGPSSPVPLWPALYLPLMFLFLNWGLGIYKAAS